MQMRVRIMMSANAGNCTKPQLRAAEPCASSPVAVPRFLFFCRRTLSLAESAR
jgi:hypothetical protein